MLLAFATPALADIEAAADGDQVVTCDDTCGCRVIDPASGKVVGTRAALPETFDIPDDEPSPMAALARCGTRCAALRELLTNDETRTLAIDPAGKLLFEAGSDYPAYGHVWSLVTGKRLTQIALDAFEGPPPTTNYGYAAFVGRHVFIGAPDKPFALTFDVFTGMSGILFEHAKLGGGLVLENDGMGRFDLADYAQPNHPRVTVRRIRARLAPEASTVMMRTIRVRDKALVIVDDPSVTLLVDPRKRTITRPRPLPRCSAP